MHYSSDNLRGTNESRICEWAGLIIGVNQALGNELFIEHGVSGLAKQIAGQSLWLSFAVKWTYLQIQQAL